MKNRGKVCSMSGCERNAYSLGLCATCYQYMHYWHERSLKDKMARKEQVQLWIERLDTMLGLKARKRRAG